MFVIFLSVGCEKTLYEHSELKTEPATVEDLVYMPPNHGWGLTPTVGVNLDGDLHVGINHVSVNIPERYAVVFRCQHGKFIIQNDQEKTKTLYQRLHRYQEVTVTYREIYEVVKEGEKIVVPPKFIRYDFIDARP